MRLQTLFGGIKTLGKHTASAPVLYFLIPRFTLITENFQILSTIC